MGGVSRRRILSIRPETFFCAVLETSVKSPRSHICTSVVKVYTTVEACQAAKRARLRTRGDGVREAFCGPRRRTGIRRRGGGRQRSEGHTAELQSPPNIASP